jgi:Ca2+ transporting ATPase
MVIRLPGENKFRLYMKGASEVILNLCTGKADPTTDGAEGSLQPAVSPFTADERAKVEANVIKPFAQATYRTIALAYKDYQGVQDWEEKLSDAEAQKVTGQVAETYRKELELNFLGLVGIEDPLRDSVPGAIAKCNRAGVDVRMVTGDNVDTAIAISKQCGIMRPDIDFDVSTGKPHHEYCCLPGSTFRKLVTSEVDGSIVKEEFDKVWPYLRVLARSSPTDKYTLVSGMIESDLFLDDKIIEDLKQYHTIKLYPDRQVVAVTGDGTNDAPALKRADVGFVMGISGTSVAKDAADIIITDDDFASIVQACLWGRNVYDSISKFLQFQLTVNISAVTLAVIGAL